MVYGQGIFDGDFKVGSGKNMDARYVKWMAMLGRCYCPVQQKRDPLHVMGLEMLEHVIDRKPWTH